MTAVTANEWTKTLLSGARGVTEIRDNEGKVMGYYAPADRADAAVYAEVAGKLDRDEIRRRKAKNASHRGYTLDEILKRLEAGGSAEPPQ